MAGSSLGKFIEDAQRRIIDTPSQDFLDGFNFNNPGGNGTPTGGTPTGGTPTGGTPTGGTPTGGTPTGGTPTGGTPAQPRGAAPADAFPVFLSAPQGGRFLNPSARAAIVSQGTSNLVPRQDVTSPGIPGPAIPPGQITPPIPGLRVPLAFDAASPFATSLPGGQQAQTAAANRVALMRRRGLGRSFPSFSGGSFI